jgi:hypothetical protein
MIFLFHSTVRRHLKRFLLRLFARCQNLSNAFHSCSTDFNQQIAQVVLFLFLCVFLFWNCRIITSNPPTSFPLKQISAGEYAVGRKIGLERVKKQLLMRQKCHKNALSFATGVEKRKSLSFPWISFSLKSLTNTCYNTIKMEGYMKRNLNIFCLRLLHGRHMLRWEGDKSVHKCMMPHCSELPIKIHILIGILSPFWIHNTKESNCSYESVVKTKKENMDVIFWGTSSEFTQRDSGKITTIQQE